MRRLRTEYRAAECATLVECWQQALDSILGQPSTRRSFGTRSALFYAARTLTIHLVLLAACLMQRDSVGNYKYGVHGVVGTARWNAECKL